MTNNFLELFIFLVEWSVIRGIETNVFNKTDFTREIVSYNLRLKKSGVDKLIRLLQASLFSRVNYKKTDCQWYTLIYDKVRDLLKISRRTKQSPPSLEKGMIPKNERKDTQYEL